MYKPTIRYLLFGQACLYGGIAVCVLLDPYGLTANDGVSYYGTYAATVIPYSIALLGAAVFGLLAARQMHTTDERYIRLSLIIYALLLAGITSTPYSAAEWVDWVHTALGSALFGLQFLLTGWLAFWRRRNRLTVSLWLFELAAGLASAYFLPTKHGYLIETQLLFQAAFSALLLYVLVHMPKGDAA